jgi:uncharacterized protein YjbI with pentapeptide repeats
LAELAVITHSKVIGKNPMTKHSTIFVTASLATLLAILALAQVAQADIFKWEYINPANPSQGKQQSTILTPDGAGASAVPGANLSNRNLSMAYLIGADLSYVPIYDAEGFEIGQITTDLTGANLSQAELNSAYLFAADLTGANLSEANMENAHLSLATLTNANLSQANLINANFQSATLTGANLTGAIVRQANFMRANFGQYQGGSGIALAQLYSTASYQVHDLTGILLYRNDLSGGNLVGQNLTNADFSFATLTGANLSQANLTNAGFYLATLTGADLTGAEVRGANFFRYDSPDGISTTQLYSTASYQAHDLTGIGLHGNNLVGANLVGQNLTNADLVDAHLINADLRQANLTNASFTADNYFGGANLTGANLSQANLANAHFGGLEYCGESTCGSSPGANLTNANLTGADARGAHFEFATLTGANTSNLIQSNGHIAGLDLTAGASLIIRDYDGNPAVSVIVVDQHLAMNATGTLRLVFDADPWDSTVSFASGIPVTRGGTLELAFAPDVNLASQIGRTIDLFDWTGVTPSGVFTVSSPYTWNLSNLYTTGEIMLTAVALLPGDYNANGIVDAADYTVWRDRLGSSTPLPNDDTPGVGPDDYTRWKNNFGQTNLGSGSGAASVSATVAEPATLLQLVPVLAVCCLRRRRNASRVPSTH